MLTDSQQTLAELGAQASPVGRDMRRIEIGQTITLIDGSLVSVLPSLVQASILK